MPRRPLPCSARRDEAERDKLVEPPDCLHRGEATRTEPCALCGMRDLVMTIYECALHNCECAARKYRHRQVPLSCATCDDRETD